MIEATDPSNQCGQGDEWDDEFYVNIDKAAELSGLSVNQIRYLEKLVTISLSRGAGRNKRFTKTDVLRLCFAGELLRSGERPTDIARRVETYKSQQPEPSSQVLHQRELVDAQKKPFADGFILAKVMNIIMVVLTDWLRRASPSSSDAADLDLRGWLSEAGKHTVEQIILPPSDESNTLAWAETLQQSFRAGLDVDAAHCLVAVSTSKGIKVSYYPDSLLIEAHERQIWPVVYRDAHGATQALVMVLADRAAHATSDGRLALSDGQSHLLLPLLDSIALARDDFITHVNTRPYRSARTSRESVQAALRLLLNKVLYRSLHQEQCEACLFEVLDEGLSPPTALKMTTWTPGVSKQMQGLTLSLAETGEGLSGWAFQRNAVAISNQTRTDPRVKYARLEASEAALAIPLSIGSDRFGVFYIFSRKESLSKGLLHMLLLISTVMAEYIGRGVLAEESERTILELNSQQFQDWLNGLVGKRPDYTSALREAIGRVQDMPGDDDNERLAVLFFDIDQSNRLSAERFGGDLLISEALIDTKDLITGLIPKHSLQGEVYLADRDHLVAILEGVRDLKSVHTLARSAMEARAAAPVKQRYEQFQITISAGLVSFPHSELQNLDIERATRAVQAGIDRIQQTLVNATQQAQAAYEAERAAILKKIEEETRPIEEQYLNGSQGLLAENGQIVGRSHSPESFSHHTGYRPDRPATFHR